MNDTSGGEESPRPPAVQPPADDEAPVRWLGRGSVVAILLKNLFFNILTFGFYRFWGRTRLRRYLWGNVELLGDPLIYTGTGMEMFKGFLFVLVALIPLGIVSTAIEFIPDEELRWVASNALGLVFLFLFFMAIYFARRYRLSRTDWRGVRFGQTGTALGYAWRKVLWLLLTVLSLGFAYPWLRMREQRYLMERTMLGDRTFSFDGRGKDLFPAWLVVYATVGLGYFWYRVKQFRYMTGQTSLETVRLNSGIRFWPTGGRVMILALIIAALFAMLIVGFVISAERIPVGSNSLNVALEDGLLVIGPMLALFAIFFFGQLFIWPLIHVPILRHVCTTLEIENPGVLSTLAQSARQAPATGEGLADAFDVGLT